MLWLDVETRSPVPIKNGTYAYAERSDILLIQFAIDDGPVSVVDIANGEAQPKELTLGLQRGPVCSHTAFDRVLLRHHGRVGESAIDRWVDTAALARAHGLPAGLMTLCDVFKLPESVRKMQGEEYVRLFCIPDKNGNYNTKATHPVEWEKFKVYGAFDVEAMRYLWSVMPKHNATPEMWESYRRDQRINDRGIPVAVPFVRAAAKLVSKAKAALDADTDEITNGQVASSNQRDALLAHILNEHGVTLPDLKSSTLERRLEDDDLPAVVRELVRIRLATSKTSTAKYAALLRSVSQDGRLRGAFVWRGAARTGRYSGRLFQPQNLSRIPKWMFKLYDQLVAAVTEEADLSPVASPMEVLGSLVRASIAAPAGKKIVTADLSNIEGRVLAWLAGETWRTEAFVALDRGEGEDLYVLSYARSFGVPVEEVHADTKAGGKMRLIGKVEELALGYQGWTGAFDSMAQNYGVELPVEKQVEVCQGWREASPSIVQFWYAMERAAIRATRTPGIKCKVGPHISFERKANWLLMRLPSGRFLCYASPRADENNTISFLGVNSYTRKWERIDTYGGKLTENACQAVALDIMEHGMVKAEEAGFEIFGSVHDELLTLIDENGKLGHEVLASCMTASPQWAAGLPLAAQGAEMRFYRKG